MKPHLHLQLQSQGQFVSSLSERQRRAKACQKSVQTYPGRVVPELCTSPDEFYSPIPGTDHSRGDCKDCASGTPTAFQHKNDIEDPLEHTAKNLERKGYLQVHCSSD